MVTTTTKPRRRSLVCDGLPTGHSGWNYGFTAVYVKISRGALTAKPKPKRALLCERAEMLSSDSVFVCLSVIKLCMLRHPAQRGPLTGIAPLGSPRTKCKPGSAVNLQTSVRAGVKATCSYRPTLETRHDGNATPVATRSVCQVATCAAGRTGSDIKACAPKD